jgi:hypothetical protein
LIVSWIIARHFAACEREKVNTSIRYDCRFAREAPPCRCVMESAATGTRCKIARNGIKKGGIAVTSPRAKLCDVRIVETDFNRDGASIAVEPPIVAVGGMNNAKESRTTGRTGEMGRVEPVVV